MSKEVTKQVIISRRSTFLNATKNIKAETSLTGQMLCVTLNLFQGLSPSMLDDNRETSPTGKTNIDRSQSTRQTGSHNSQARWFALSNKFGMTQSGTRQLSRHSERICVRTECNESGLREYRVGRAVRLENEAIRAWSKFKTLVSGSKNNNRRVAFTLAEVLITLGIIGVVAAMTLPSMITNIQEKVKKEQVRTVKYKLTLATDKMKSLDRIGGYSSNDETVTEEFITELKNHFKIAKICDNNNLRGCWPTDKISTPDGEVSVSSLANGTQLKALALGTANTKTMGIVTGDGTPMILLYSPVCNALDPAKTYTWSMIDNKPETNATTNCISAIFDINGAKKPNRLGSDVRTLNSIFGSKQYSATAVTKDECEELRKKHLVNGCNYDTDYYAGAVKTCNDIGLHLPSMETLSVIAGAKYGRTDVGVHTIVVTNSGTYTKDNGFQQAANSDFVVAGETDIPNGTNSAISSLSGYFWSGSERDASTAWRRGIASYNSSWAYDNRDNVDVPLCVGD